MTKTTGMTQGTPWTGVSTPRFRLQTQTNPIPATATAATISKVMLSGGTESSGPAPGRAQDREEREQPDHGHEQDPTEDGGDVAADQIVDHIVRDAYDTPDRSLVDVEHVDEDALPPQQAGQCHDERGIFSLVISVP